MEVGRWSSSWLFSPPSVIRPVVVPYPFFCFWANTHRSPFAAPAALPLGWMDTLSSVTSDTYGPRSSAGQSAFSPVSQPERSTSQDKNDTPSQHDSGFFDDSLAGSGYSSPEKLPEFSYLLHRASVNAALKTGSSEEGQLGLSSSTGSQPFAFAFVDGGPTLSSSEAFSPSIVQVQRAALMKKMGRPPKQSTAVTSHKLRPLLSKATSTTSSAMSDASWSCSPEPASPSDNHFIPLFGCTSAGESSHEFPSQLDTVKEEVVVTTECIIPFSKPVTSEFSKVYASFVPPKPVLPPPQVNLLSSSCFQIPLPVRSKVEEEPSRKRSLTKKRSAVTSGISGVNGDSKGANDAKRKCGEPKRANTERKSYRSTSVCDICGREFRYPRSLLTHQLVHQDIRPHKCPFPSCDKSFRQTGHLQTHLLIHTGDKPFKCPVEGCPTQPFRHANRRCPLHSSCRLVKLGGNGEPKPLDLSSHPLVFSEAARPVSPKKTAAPSPHPQRGFQENGKQRQEDVAMAMALIQFANGPVPQSRSPAGMK